MENSRQNPRPEARNFATLLIRLGFFNTINIWSTLLYKAHSNITSEKTNGYCSLLDFNDRKLKADTYFPGVLPKTT